MAIIIEAIVKSIQRIPLSRFMRLNGRDQKECFQKYTGKWIRYALAATDLEGRKPGE